MNKIKQKIKCCGCYACKDTCAQDAISFIEDNEGFNYPKINYEKCIDCGKCKKICPITNPVSGDSSLFECYASWNKDIETRMKSSSGGLFSLLANEIINEDGYVVAVELNNELKVQHFIFDDEKSLKKARKAKYVQSNTIGIYNEIEDLLKEQKKVLFSGTPCQVAGLKRYLKKQYLNLFTVEIICHGVVSQKTFDYYLKSLQKRNQSIVVDYDFRNKDISWKNYSVKAKLSDGNEYLKNKNEDEYMKGYLLYNLYLRPSCTDCPYKTFPRVADITLGDFWGVNNYLSNIDDKGTSAVIINSDKGKQLFETIKDKVIFKRVSIESIIENNSSLVESTSLGKYSLYYYKHINKTDFIKLINIIEEKIVWNKKGLKIKDRLFLLKKKFLG